MASKSVITPFTIRSPSVSQIPSLIQNISGTSDPKAILDVLHYIKKKYNLSDLNTPTIINGFESYPMDLICYSIKIDSSRLFKYLIEKSGILFTYQDENNKDFLDLAIECTSFSIMRVLFESGVETTLEEKNKILLLICRFNDYSRQTSESKAELVSMVKMLLDQGADPNYSEKINRNSIDFTMRFPLERAIMTDKIEIVKCLLVAGADPNAFNGISIKSAVTHSYEPKILELLIENGADLSMENLNLLNEAIKSQHEEIVDLLLDHRVPICKIESSNLKTAVKDFDLSLIRKLVEAGVDFNPESDNDYLEEKIKYFEDLGMDPMNICRLFACECEH